jgi:Pvc16 N-terminal domain
MYTWIRASTITIRELLREHFESDANLRTFFNPLNGTMVVSASTPQEMVDSSIAGLSVWLYHIVRDEQTHNRPPSRIGVDQVERHPLPLRLHYLMTPITDNDEGSIGSQLEQSIIGKVIQTLHDHPLLSGAFLRDDLVGSHIQIGIRLEPLALEEITRIWDALEQSYQLCISYKVSVVMLGSDQEVERIAPVDAVDSEYGLINGGAQA